MNGWFDFFKMIYFVGDESELVIDDDNIENIKEKLI